MYMQNNKIFIFFIAFLLAANFAYAAKQETPAYIKEFMKNSEFMLQKKVVKANSFSNKGFIKSNNVNTIENLIKVDLVDPFENKSIKGQQANLNLNLISDEYQESPSFLDIKTTIENYFKSLEENQNIDYVGLLDKITINRIVSSPLKYVIIEGKKYNINSKITVQVNSNYNQSEFNEMINSLQIQDADEREQDALNNLKAEAFDRYQEVMSKSNRGDGLVEILINDIRSHEIEFKIKDRKYKVVLRK